MYKLMSVLGISIVFFVSFFTKPTFAADDCTIIYGGGETKCQATKSAETATPAPTAQQPATSSGTTKGGLPVYSPTPATQTPPTGPEAFGLLGLIPAAAAGFWLRKKTN